MFCVRAVACVCRQNIVTWANSSPDHANGAVVLVSHVLQISLSTGKKMLLCVFPATGFDMREVRSIPVLCLHHLIDLSHL